MRAVLLLVVVLWTIVATACGSDGPGTDEPPEIRFGEDICDQCNMIISDERFASAYRTVDGTVRRFDDIGGMAIYHSVKAESVESFWVHDVETLEWLKAPEAWFVRSDEILSPMGHGLAAYKAEDQAVVAAEETGGEVVRWNEVLSGAIVGN